MHSTQKQLADTHLLLMDINVRLISRSLDNICHYYTFYLSGDVLLSLNKLDLNSSNVHTILAAITGPMEVTYTCICISYTEISLMVQFSPCLKFYSPLFQKSPSFKNPHFQHNAKCKLTFLVEITLIQKFLRFRNSAWDFLGVNFWSRDFLGFCWKPQTFSCRVLFLPPFDHPGHLKSEVHPLGNPGPLALSDISALCSKAFQQALCHYANDAISQR